MRTTFDWSGETAALSMIAAGLLVASMLAWALALGHMAELGAVCGLSRPDCIWCGVGTTLGLAGLAALVVAVAAAAAESPDGDMTEIKPPMGLGR